LSKHLKVISFTATADCVHAHVSVADIVKGKIHFLGYFKTIILPQVFKTVKKVGEVFYTSMLSTYLHITIFIKFSSSCAPQRTPFLYSLWQCNKLEQ